MDRRSGLELHLLGTPSARYGGVAVPGLAEGKMQAVLGYLVLECGSQHPREQLAELFWPKQSVHRARTNLRHLLHHLQSALNRPGVPPLLVGSRESVGFNLQAEVWVDALRFKSDASRGLPSAVAKTAEIEQQLALYRGPLLNGVSVDSSNEFLDWLEEKRECFHRKALRCADRLVQDWSALGDRQRALAAARRRVALDPLDEPGCRTLMRLLWEAGDLDSARECYDEFCLLLDRELAARPTPETVALFRRIDQRPAGLERAPPQSRLELRQVTVLSCRFGFPSSSVEDAVILMRECQNRGLELLRNYGGWGLKTQGGRLIGYFGYPQARADAIGASVRAAVALRQMTGVQEIRQGIDTGSILTDGDCTDPDPEGLLSRTAQGWQEQAGAGEILLGPATANVLHGYADLSPVDPPAGGEGCSRFIRWTGARSRLDARPPAPLLVGRALEMERLRARWRDCLAGRGGCVALQGEAGIGKSRILFELRETARGQEAVILEWRCLPESSGSPYFPVIEMFAGVAGLTAEGLADELARGASPVIERQPLFAAPATVAMLRQLLGLEPAAGSSTDAGRRRWQRALADILVRYPGGETVLLMVEDVHWIDPSSLELLTAVIEAGRSRPLLAVVSFRPEFAGRPALGTECEVIELDGLGETAARELVHAVPGAHNLAPETVLGIVRQAGGVPLYIEELCALAVARGGGITGQLPAALHDPLKARLDQLGPALALVQVAAVLGSEFRAEWLQALAEVDTETFTHGIRGLLTHGCWVQSDGHADHYRFRHVLLQEAAYQSLTVQDRRRRHRQAAGLLADRAPELADTRPELLARHWSAAGEPARAAPYWLAAARRVAAQGAYHEAVAHCRAGLADLERMEAEVERDALERDLLLTLLGPLSVVRGYWADELRALAARAQALCWGGDDTRQLFRLVWGRWLVSLFHEGVPQARAVAEELGAIAARSADPMLAAGACYARCDTLFWAGDFAACRDFAEEALQRLEPLPAEAQFRQFGHGLEAFARSKLIHALNYLGEADRAGREMEALVELAERGSDPNAWLSVSVSRCAHRFFHDDVAGVLETAEQGLRLTRRQDLAHWAVILNAYRLWALAAQGDRQALAYLDAHCRQAAAQLPAKTAGYLYFPADVYVRTGQWAEGLKTLREVRRAIRRYGEGYRLGETFHLLSKCVGKMRNSG